MLAQKFNAEITEILEDMITEAIFCSNLTEFAEQARQIIAYANKNNLNIEDVLEELFDDIESQHLLDLEDTQYQCLQDDSAVRMFLYTDWSFYKKQNGPTGNTNYIEKLLSEISHNAGRKTDGKRAEHIVKEILELIRTDIDIFAVMPDDHSLNIAIVDSAETRYEGYVIGHMPTSPNRLYHQIIVSNLLDDSTKGKEIYALLKTLGNVYLFSLTGSFEKMPKGFSAIQKVFAAESVVDMELFSELFAMSLCTKPELRQCDAHPNISMSLKKKLYEYMMQLALSGQAKQQFGIIQLLPGALS